MIVRGFWGKSSPSNMVIIKITGPSETDTVSVTTPSGITINLTWKGEWSLSASELGMYTVTASNGTKTKTQDVLVDVSGEYTVAWNWLPNNATAYFPFITMSDEINGLTWSKLTGSPQLSTDSPFGVGHSLYLNGSSSVTSPYSALLDLTTQATIEFFAKVTRNASTGNNFIYGNPIRSGTFKNGFGLYVCNDTDVNNKKLAVAYGNGSSEMQKTIGSPSDIIDSAWHHWSLNRNDNTFTVYKDGQLFNSFTANMVNGTAAFLIGKSRDTSYYWTGYITEILVVQGEVLRTENFIPPTEAYL